MKKVKKKKNDFKYYRKQIFLLPLDKVFVLVYIKVASSSFEFIRKRKSKLVEVKKMRKKKKKKIKEEEKEEEFRETREIKNVRIETNEFTGGTSIKIFFPKMEEDNIWSGDVKKRSEPYSENQIRIIWNACRDQIKAMDPDKIPIEFHQILKKFEEVIKERGIFI
ncbi:MAG: hypothetical protein ACKKMO_02985 [Candidatus Nealsonbacteria bacterium]